MKPLRIGTRGSPLALWQAQAVSAALERSGAPPGEIVRIRTTGDRLATAALSEVGGKAVFVKEIENALLHGTIDIAVHSAKDLPARLPPGLEIRGVLPRADPRDAIAGAHRASDSDTPTVQEVLTRSKPGPTIGTGSVRRAAQLARRYPSAQFAPIRGNVGTRLQKLDAGVYDLLVLATAGLERLGLADRVSMRLPVDDCVPAPGQGIVAIEARVDDDTTGDLLAAITDPATAVALEAERTILTALGGDCHVPIGAVAVDEPGAGLRVRAIVASVDGASLLSCERQGPHDDAGALGRAVAAELLAKGAAELIAAGRPRLQPDASS